MARSGHGPALVERRLNAGLQTLPSGRSAFPIARYSEHHRSIGQKLPELWADFSDRGLEEARAGHDAQRHQFHGGPPGANQGHTDGGSHERSARNASNSTGGVATQSGNVQKSGQCIFAGFVEFDMDGRTHTAGEMDRMMMMAAASKYPCSRPATFDEYAERRIIGLPRTNTSGRDVAFVGPGATGCELFHTNTLGSQKVVVPPNDTFDGSWGTASLYGRKSCLCIIPVERAKRQQSLTQFGLLRHSLGPTSGRLRRAGSLATLSDKTQWAAGNFAASTQQSQQTSRADQFFR